MSTVIFFPATGEGLAGGAYARQRLARRRPVQMRQERRVRRLSGRPHQRGLGPVRAYAVCGVFDARAAMSLLQGGDPKQEEDLFVID